MEKKTLEKLVNEGLSIRQISKELSLSIGSIRYWLNKHNLKTKHRRYNKSTDDDLYKKCPICEQILLRLNDFYKGQAYCKKCLSNKYKEKSVKRKILAVTYKGCICNDCGASYPDNSYVIFDFHHLDPNEKEYNWREMRFMSEDKMKKELDKCILLCANCHRIRHHKL